MLFYSAFVIFYFKRNSLLKISSGKTVIVCAKFTVSFKVTRIVE